jgi:hypothetical protein
MKKELIVFIQSNEEGEHIRVSRVDDGTNRFMLLTAGQNRMVVDVQELMEGIGAIGHYSALFDQEEKMKAMRDAARPARTVEVPTTIPVAKPKGKAKVDPEDEGALILEAQMRSGPTASELALEAQTRHMHGDSLEIREKK